VNTCIKQILPALALIAIAASAGGAERVVLPKQALAIYTPKPTYPFLALVKHEEGKGLFVLRINIKSGRVKEVIVARTTGHTRLDKAASEALRQWKFQPDVLAPITKILPNAKDPRAAEDSLAKVPITFEIR